MLYVKNISNMNFMCNSNTKTIETFIGDNIPLIVTMSSVIILKHQEVPYRAPITTSIVKNLTQKFCVKGVNIILLSLVHIDSYCVS